MISRTRQVLVSPSTYPLTAFWLMATIILPLAVSGALTLNVGVGLLTCTALALIVIAFKRALNSVHEQHVELVERVQQLTEGLIREKIPIPPTHPRKT